MDLRRPLFFLVFAALCVLISWWDRSADPDSPRMAAKMAVAAWVSPGAGVAFLVMAVARVLVTGRVVAALYGRPHAGGVELTGFTGRFGWVFARRVFSPGPVGLTVEAVAPVRSLPTHVISVRQGAVSVTVTADTPWSLVTRTTLAAWLAANGCRADVPSAPVV